MAGPMASAKPAKSPHSSEYQAFLALLVQARKDAGLSQVQAAERYGKPQSFISKCESGERRVDVVELVRFCEIYGIEMVKFVHDLVKITNFSQI